MSKLGENGWKSALNDEVLHQILGDIINQEIQNLLCKSLPQQNFFDYQPTLFN